MKTYEYCILDELIDGVQTVRFERRNDRPNDPMPQGAVIKARDIERVTEQTGTTTDPETGEEVPVMPPVADKYHKWDAAQLVAMSQDERDAVDAREKAAYIEANRKAWEAENKFFLLIHSMYGDMKKRGFDELNATIQTLAATDQDTASALALQLLAVDAECKREGGDQWWDTAAYHEDVGE